MKKIILSLCILSLLTGTAFAACNGGTMRGGFCVSNIQMNWGSAQAWCQANGRSLATIYDACPDWDGNTGRNCGRIIDSSFNDWIRTSTVSGISEAYIVYLGSESVDKTKRDYSLRDGYGSPLYALCR